MIRLIRLPLFATLLIFSASPLLAQNQCSIVNQSVDPCPDCEPVDPPPQQPCPPCFSDQKPLAPHSNENNGGKTSDGRTILHVYIGPTYQTDAGGNYAPGQYNPAILSAVRTAVNMWNNATESNGSHIPYFIDVLTPQSGDAPANVDFVINKEDPANMVYPTADINLTIYPHNLRIAAGIETKAEAVIAAFIAHEIGHRIGLSEAAGCGQVDMSIMQGVDLPPFSAR